jgi:hypothetical protein
LQPFRFLPFFPFLHFFAFFLATAAGPLFEEAGTASTAPARNAARTAIVILVVAAADNRPMTSEQMDYRAQQAEHLLKRYTELEREHESAGFYEEALEARRLRLEQEAAVSYWRDRASEPAQH